MILCAIFGMALATVATADLAFHFRLRGGPVFLAAFNIGALLSGMLLTADVLALGLALAGVALMVRRKLPWTLVALALAGLTKETYLLVPLSLAAYQWRDQRRKDAIALAVIPVLPIALWSIWVWTIIPAVQRSTSHIGLPMTGLLTSLSKWMQSDGVDFVLLPFAVYAVISFVAGSVMLAAGRSVLLRLVMAPWIIMAGLASVAVWGIPTNVARAFPILWPLSVLLLRTAAVERSQ